MEHDYLLWQVGPASAHGQGLFATCNLRTGLRLMAYRGPCMALADVPDTRGEPLYWMALDADRVIDGRGPENIARRINHACAPNCEAVCEGERIWIETREPIAAGSELTLDYGWGLDGLFQRPCRCGTAPCIGYIVGAAYRPLAQKLLRQMRRKR